MAAGTGTPIKKICKKGKIPIAALILLLLFNAGIPPREIGQKMAEPKTAQEVYKLADSTPGLPGGPWRSYI